MDTQDEGMYGKKPVRYRRVSDHETSGDYKHGHTITSKHNQFGR
ncbi:hypothetical protein [Desulfitispora alkaliphila]